MAKQEDYLPITVQPLREAEAVVDEHQRKLGTPLTAEHRERLLALSHLYFLFATVGGFVAELHLDPPESLSLFERVTESLVVVAVAKITVDPVEGAKYTVSYNYEPETRTYIFHGYATRAVGAKTEWKLSPIHLMCNGTAFGKAWQRYPVLVEAPAAEPTKKRTMFD